ncbi:DMT family transporter [Schaalia hyovaginalis]|nr:DMT family transporter [Schaalia hyovaginalis]
MTSAKEGDDFGESGVRLYPGPVTSRPILLPALALTVTTAVWGSTFFMVKDIVVFTTPLDFLGVRFAIAALAIIVLRGRRLLTCSPTTWRRGLSAGAVYAAAQIAQTYGLKTADASVSGFITGMYVVLTPVILFLVFRVSTPARVWVATILATAGLAVLSLQGFALGTGEALSFLGAVLYAIHIIVLGRWAGQEKGLDLAAIQMIAIGAICGAAALPGGIGLPRGVIPWAEVLYMALISGLLALIVQTWAQARIPAARAAVIMTTEPVFAALFAILFGGESLSGRLLLGGGLVLAAMLLAELGPTASPRPARDGRRGRGAAGER